ncbi:hypothetical protein ABW21_db0206488 [Orbilia brochopaga]|nr:hypothetical protein ABW21_db0206488 [Drechslerella brochopaga]
MLHNPNGYPVYSNKADNNQDANSTTAGTATATGAAGAGAGAGAAPAGLPGAMAHPLPPTEILGVEGLNQMTAARNDGLADRLEAEGRPFLSIYAQ